MNHSSAAFDTVVFDCDSTLSRIEGIDELARKKGVYREVQQITAAAMEGALDFDEALAHRLQRIQPTRSELTAIGRLYVDNITKDSAAVIRSLTGSGIRVFVVSGGFLDSILPLAEYLGIDQQNVFANEVYFDEKGGYRGYNTRNPAAWASGKKEITERLPGRKIFVGDGASDLHAKWVVELFVGYCGVHARQMVVEQADLLIESESLAPLLAVVFPKRPDADRNADLARLWDAGHTYWKSRKTIPLSLVRKL